MFCRQLIYMCGRLFRLGKGKMVLTEERIDKAFRVDNFTILVNLINRADYLIGMSITIRAYCRVTKCSDYCRGVVKERCKKAVPHPY